jgi:hypothetical protein
MRFLRTTRRYRHRLTAVLGIALVLALNVLAVMPAAHAWLHGGDTDAPAAPCRHHGCAHESPAPAEDDDCVVVKFAHGDGGLVTSSFVVEAHAHPLLAPFGLRHALPAPAPAYLLPPGCGPPAI